MQKLASDHSIFRYITYQQKTKIYDKDWGIDSMSDTDVESILELFESYFASIVEANLRYLLFLETQYSILWQYTFTPKKFNPKSKPYMWVIHLDTPEKASPDFMPMYYKSSIDAGHQKDYYATQGITLNTAILYRNCLVAVERFNPK